MKSKGLIITLLLFLVSVLLFASHAIAADAPSFSWAEQIGVNGKYKWDQAYALTTDSLGNVIVSGSISGTVIFGDTTIDGGPFIAKYDGNGNILWARSTSTTGYSSPTCRWNSNTNKPVAQQSVKRRVRPRKRPLALRCWHK